MEIERRRRIESEGGARRRERERREVRRAGTGFEYAEAVWG